MPAPPVDDLRAAPALVLARMRADRHEADAAERRILLAAATYADLHPAVEPLGPSPSLGEVEAVLSPLPAVDVTAPAELGPALGLSHDAASRLLTDALHLRHRLPRVWAEVDAGRVQAWRARRIAQATTGRPDDVLAVVDARVADVAQRIGLVTLDRLLTAALMRLHPEETEAHQQEQLDARHVTLRNDVSHLGTAHMEIAADLADLLGFDDAVAAVAQALADRGCPESLDVRRSMAVGVLAEPHAAATLLNGSFGDGTPPSGRHWADDAPHPAGDDSSAAPDRRSRAAVAPGPAARPPAGRRRQVVLYAHASAETLQHDGDVVARVETPGDGTGVPILETHLRRWLGRPDATVVIRPVIDLDDHQRTDAYEIPDRLREQVMLRDGHCAFPHCRRPARACDLDHVVPHGVGGSTCSCNLAPLCRRHHRLKTHRGWSYSTVEPGTWLWRSPAGYTYLVDPTGTRDLTPPTHHPGSGCHHPDG